ncbi:MAG: UvrABC system protein C [bacterium ADurb.Bin478]|nr:MAG: UvrABC system protein C [bacterium ADurb.Bin478]
MRTNLLAQIDRSPQTPGVYLLKDREGGILYVGKSINLRKRLQQHGAALKAEWMDRDHRRVRHVKDVAWQETHSELYALLLEDYLIKKHWPMANVRQKDYLAYVYLALSAEPLPRFVLIDARQRAERPQSFGPFRDRYHAQDMLELVQERFRLRTCPAIRKGGCLQWEMHRCSAPCRTLMAAERYRRTVARAAESLRSLDPYFLRFIANRIKVCAQHKEFEKAAHYHTMLLRYQGLIDRSTFFARFRKHGLFIQESGRWPNTFLFLEGRLVQRNGERVDGRVVEGVDFNETCTSEWTLVDRADVIYRWLRSRPGQSAMAFIDRQSCRAASYP